MTIEEAWATLNPSPGRVYHDRKFTSHAEDVRTLALAVLEEVLEVLEAVMQGDPGRYGDALSVSEYVLSGVREQIEALGKAEDGA